MGYCLTVCIFPGKQRTDAEYTEVARQSAAMFRAAPGLIRKDYVRGAEGSGGIYLWESRAAAESWFTDKMIAQYAASMGVQPVIQWYDSLFVVENRVPADA